MERESKGGFNLDVKLTGLNSDRWVQKHVAPLFKMKMNSEKECQADAMTADLHWYGSI